MRPPPIFTISFQQSLSGQTITLSSTLTLTNTTSGVTIYIQGSGANLLTISGNNALQVFSISAGTTVNIPSLTIANGNAALPNAGGGIFSRDTLTVSNS